MTNEAASGSLASGALLQLLRQHGFAALESALAGVGGRLPRSNLGYLAELLLAFSRRLPNETRAWLKSLMNQVSLPVIALSVNLYQPSHMTALPERVPLAPGDAGSEGPLLEIDYEVRVLGEYRSAIPLLG